MSDISVNRNTSLSLYALDSADPKSELVDRQSMAQADVQQIDRLMAAMGKLRESEDLLVQASTKYMKLNRTDMKALRFLIVCENTGNLATPGELATYLDITTASTTKLLDRLEQAGHIVRKPHPSDRRALVIHITTQTRNAAMSTIGKQQAKRFKVAAERTTDQREILIAFFEDMAKALSLEGVNWPEDQSESAPA
jgi:DNA-binding MarR family transcriptional regulator